MRWIQAVLAAALLACFATPLWAQDDASGESSSPYTYGGSVDGYISHNFNEPFNGLNFIRAFDVDDDKLALGLIDIWLERANTPVGFRLDLQFGPTSELVQAFEPNKSDVMDRIQQIYVSANLDPSARTRVDFGKWVTMHGAELIEPADNWLYTRGLLFTWAIPFYHTGLRVHHDIDDSQFVMFNLTQGWNTSFQENEKDGDPAYGVSYGRTQGKTFVVVNYQGGTEPGVASFDNGIRHLVDIVSTYEPGGPVSFTGNFDYGTQEGVSTGRGRRRAGVEWYGFSGQVKYQVNDKQYVALRGEVLRDADGFLFGAPQTVAAITGGYTVMVHPNFQVRAEVRHDWSNTGQLFPSSTRGRFHGAQTTIGLAGILTY